VGTQTLVPLNFSAVVVPLDKNELYVKGYAELLVLDIGTERLKFQGQKLVKT